MAIDSRFTKMCFAAEFEREPSSSELVDALEQEVQRQLHAVLLPKVKEIIEQLNALGHHLKPYGLPEPGDIGFRDEDDAGECELRLGVDTIVSIGFRDTVEPSG